jgi:hypothetical protein
LEKAINIELINLISINYQFIVEEKLADIFQIDDVELFARDDLDEELRYGDNHLVSLWGIVAAKEKTQNGFVKVNLIFRESNIEIKFDWNSKEFSINNVGSFRFSKSKF